MLFITQSAKQHYVVHIQLQLSTITYSFVYIHFTAKDCLLDATFTIIGVKITGWVDTEIIIIK